MWIVDCGLIVLVGMAGATARECEERKAYHG